MTQNNNALTVKKGAAAAGIVSPRPGQTMGASNPYLNSLDAIIQKNGDGKNPEATKGSLLSQK